MAIGKGDKLGGRRLQTKPLQGFQDSRLYMSFMYKHRLFDACIYKIPPKSLNKARLTER